MSKREYILRYLLVLKKLRSNREASFDEINEWLKREEEISGDRLTISKRTFQRDLNDIRSIFKADIQSNSRNKYFIAHDEQEDANNRMLEAFDMLNSLSVTDNLSQYVHFEKRKPQGTEHFYGLLHAIKNNFIVKFTHQKYWEDGTTQRTAEPYSLKEFKSRWYILGKDKKDDKIKTFGLDRMQNLTITNQKFDSPKNFNANNLFKYCFGIINPTDSQPVEIVLSFEPTQGKYIKSFPLHDSQQIIKDNDDELRIKLKLHITHDLIMELLSHGDSLKIISPAKLKKEVGKILAQTLQQYK